ncbi:MAG TPA: dTMP kinase [Patescibacteria group bacterium]|nr:dTMP kinase [Patescibacteria group bacterium]
MKHHVAFDLAFTRNTYGGKYYSFEGIDGSGKTTQAKLLAEYFQKQGKEVVWTKEPTDGEVGQLIRKILRKELVVPPLSLQYLFCADRAIHLQEVVIPALKEGKIVISDRSLWSSIAYGMTDLGLPDNERERLLITYNLLSLYGGYLIADTTFLLRLPYDVAVSRIDTRGKEKSLYEISEKLKGIEKAYEWMGREFPDAITIVEGDHHHSPEQIHEKVIALL